MSDKSITVLVPIYNEEEDIISSCINRLINAFSFNKIVNYEIIIIDDSPKFKNNENLLGLKLYDNILFKKNIYKKGFGNSVKYGIELSKSDYISIFMVDGSDDANDLIKFYRIAQEKKLDFVLGDRWSKNSTNNYPRYKLLINRIANKLISKLFNFDYSDFTNSFKLYSRPYLNKISPFYSDHFNITIELPLKCLIFNGDYEILNNSWTGDKNRVSSLNLRKLFLSYFLTMIHCLIIKYFKKNS